MTTTVITRVYADVADHYRADELLPCISRVILAPCCRIMPGDLGPDILFSGKFAACMLR